MIDERRLSFIPVNKAVAFLEEFYEFVELICGLSRCNVPLSNHCILKGYVIGSVPASFVHGQESGSRRGTGFKKRPRRV